MTELQTFYAPKSIDDAVRIASAMSSSKMFPDIKNPEMAFAKMMAGAELGFGPFASISGVDIIQGRPALSARLIASAVKASNKYDFIVQDHSDKLCKIEFFEYSLDRSNKESIGTSEFTIEDAKKAGLTNRDNWKKYPRNMLYARAISNGVRWHCPDIFHGGAYTHEELGVEDPVESGEPVEVDSYVVSDVNDTPDYEHEQVEEEVSAIEQVKEQFDGEEVKGGSRYYKWLNTMKEEKKRIGPPVYYSILRSNGLQKSNDISPAEWVAHLPKVTKIYNAMQSTQDYRDNNPAWKTLLSCVEGRRLKNGRTQAVTPLSDLLATVLTVKEGETPIEETDDLEQIDHGDLREQITDVLSEEYYK